MKTKTTNGGNATSETTTPKTENEPTPPPKETPMAKKKKKKGMSDDPMWMFDWTYPLFEMSDVFPPGVECTSDVAPDDILPPTSCREGRITYRFGSLLEEGRAVAAIYVRRSQQESQDHLCFPVPTDVAIHRRLGGYCGQIVLTTSWGTAVHQISLLLGGSRARARLVLEAYGYAPDADGLVVCTGGGLADGVAIIDAECAARESLQGWARHGRIPREDNLDYRSVPVVME